MTKRRTGGSRIARCSMALLSAALVIACGGKPKGDGEHRSGSESEADTVPVPECQDYARELRACFERTGVPAANALAAADANARAPRNQQDARAASCARQRALLRTTCR